MIDMALMMDELLQKIVPLAESDPDIAVVWLYGSRAKGNAHASSDYDLAVAFNRFIKDDPIEQRLRPECLALDWQQTGIGFARFPTLRGRHQSGTDPVGVGNHSSRYGDFLP